MRQVIKITAAAALFVLIVAMAIGAHRRSLEPITMYNDAYITVTRTGRFTSVLDGATGKEYSYTTTRRKRATSHAEAAQRAKTKISADTPTIHIETAYDVLIITEKATGDTLIFKSH